jgi:hypothetical protein
MLAERRIFLTLVARAAAETIVTVFASARGNIYFASVATIIICFEGTDFIFFNALASGFVEFHANATLLRRVTFRVSKTLTAVVSAPCLVRAYAFTDACFL